MQPRDATIPPARDIADTLQRIAAALERLAPPDTGGDDPLGGEAFVWTGAQLRTVPFPPVRPLELLLGIEAQKDALRENVTRHAKRLPAHDVLLWGARGMGKSALAKAVAADLRDTGLALIEVARADIGTLPALFRRLGSLHRRFLLFCDDLSFEVDERDHKALRSVLEGGIEERPGNCRLIVTSNRRHLMPRSLADNEAAAAVNPRDTLDDKIALADRFGLSLGFHNCDQATYLAIVAGYAEAFDLPFDDKAALTWATGRGARSGRVAWHYTQEVAGRMGVELTPPS